LDLEFTDDQTELRRSVRGFLERECPPALVRRVVETGEPAVDLWTAMTKLDWPALAVPEEFGGIGLSFVEVAVVVEELGACIAPGPYLATVTQFVPAVREAGTEEQRRRFLGAVASGAITGSLALADHPNRWRVGEVTATAERGDGGWRLFGQKPAVLATPDVDEVVVAARIVGSGGNADDRPAGAGGIGLFVVPGADLKITPEHSLDASRPLARIALDGVGVSDDRALGTPGTPESGEALARAAEEAAVALALEALGACQRLFDLTLEYSKNRHQFGVPIGSFQAVKHKMADLFVSIERTRALVYYAVAAIAEDDPNRSLASAMAKAAANDCQRLVCQESIQTFGGIAFTWEHDVQLYVKRATTDGALFGSSAEHRVGVAELLGVTRSS
jgi:acyl-CoA dehydrogenase